MCFLYLTSLADTFVSLIWHTNSDVNKTPQGRAKDPQLSFQLRDLKAQHQFLESCPKPEVKHFQFSIS